MEGGVTEDEGALRASFLCQVNVSRRSVPPRELFVQ